MPAQELFHDWNGSAELGELARAEVLDETLRDGIQSPSAVDPPIAAKIEILHLLDELGVAQLDVGLPGAGPHQRAAVKRLAEEKRDARLRIRLNVACRTVVSDVAPAAEVQQETGVPLAWMAVAIDGSRDPAVPRYQSVHMRFEMAGVSQAQAEDLVKTYRSR